MKERIYLVIISASKILGDKHIAVAMGGNYTGVDGQEAYDKALAELRLADPVLTINPGTRVIDQTLAMRAWVLENPEE